LVGGLASGRLVSQSGTRAGALAGAVAGLLAYGAFAGFSRTVLAIVLIMIPIGFGTGLAIAAITDLAVLAAMHDETGVTVGLTSVVRAVGSALGAAVAVAIWTGAPKIAPGLPGESGITRAFVMALIATGVAVAAVTLIPRRSADPVLEREAEERPALEAASP
jgi:MFS family permease